jgi:hypothetical protein
VSDKEQTLWGLPVVLTDAMPKGEIILGRMPTDDEIKKHGSFAKAVEA